jgi:hypothetical protein
MSADIVPIRGELMSSADEAHRRLRKAYSQLEADYWAIADAMHEAHVSEAWMRDDRAHEARYRQIMTEQNLRSIFFAYVYDEFGVREGGSSQIDMAGRLRANVNPSAAAEGLDWSRFTMRVVRPIGAAIIDTYEADDVAAALVTAQHVADKERTARQVADDVVPPVKPSHVRAALVEHGLVPPRAKGLDEMESAERRAVKLERAEVKARDGLEFLIAERRRKAATDIITAAIRRLADHPASLAKIRQALDEVTAS